MHSNNQFLTAIIFCGSTKSHHISNRKLRQKKMTKNTDIDACQHDMDQYPACTVKCKIIIYYYESQQKSP